MAAQSSIVRGFQLKYEESFIREAETALRGVLERGWTSEGPEVRKFEDAFGALCPAKHRVATTSCTMALEIAFRALGVRGRKVILPTNTFYATALAAVNAGAEVELVDVDAETFALCPKALEVVLSNLLQSSKSLNGCSDEKLEVAAVVLVHVAGTIPHNVDAILDICARWKVPLVEDAAQAHGARSLTGVWAGCFGTVACFSFFATKAMTTGEGGMIVTNDDALAAKIQNLKNFGRMAGSSAADLKCEVSDGVNGRVPEVVGLLGVLECARAPSRIDRRRDLAAKYARGLRDEPLYKVLCPPESSSSCYKVIVRLRGGLKRKYVREECLKRGVELSGEVWATPVHRQPAFESAASGRTFPVADSLADTHICPPLYPELSDIDVDTVVNALIDIAQKHNVAIEPNGDHCRSESRSRSRNRSGNQPLVEALPTELGANDFSRYIVLAEARCIEVRKEPLRPPGPGEVLIRVGASGICGSDLHYFRHGGLGTHAAKMPMRMGHEVAGFIEVLGDGDVCGLRVGDRVAVEPAGSCSNCNFCGRGRRNLCSFGTFLGAEGSTNGGLADVLVVPARQCVALPAHLSMKIAALIEPLSVGLYSCRVVGIQPGETFGVVGCGCIGLSILFCALKEGGSCAWCIEPIEERRALAQEFGASKVVAPGSVGQDVRKADVVFDVVGTDESFATALDYVSVGGRIALVGIPEQDHLLYNPHRARIKGITLFNIRRSNVPMSECLPLLSESKDVALVEKMATHPFDFSDAQRHFELASSCASGVLRCYLAPSGAQQPS